ncbi:MAG: C69 family dipeptidase [Alloprevotella sp.]|nr:C69 family dipeptidase [Bacteroidales bacterium]MDY2778580.1 C69 family dipeptidase [Alloprevotella sp.]
MIKQITTAAIALCTLVWATPSTACTNFLVGKKASADGSTFITYNADSYGMFGRLVYYPAAQHAPGTMRQIYDGDTNEHHGQIAEAPVTYSVMGNINEHQVAITETTFGGREELVDTAGIIDYVSLMAIALQRSKTAREAIAVMTSLVQEYGYASSGESFSIADPNEVWILEMIGKGSGRRGTVWVAVRIPDDCIAVHANQSRIHKFDLKDKRNVLYSKDVISFARERGYFNGKDADFSFSAAYAPADFGSQRYCDARAWSFFNRWVDGMDRYLDFVDGKHIGTAEVMPLYFKPNRPVTLKELMMSNRDHYEGTPFDITHDAGAGIYEAPYRPTPLSFEVDGKTYFNERPISTQQSAFTVVAQLRGNLPNAIGGILWFGNDDPNMIAYTPVYCCADRVPPCYDKINANDITFSWDNAFWVCNWVANMTYPRYSQLFPSVEAVRDRLEDGYIARQADIEKQALALYETSPAEARKFLTDYTVETAQNMLGEWKKLGEYLIVKYNDQAVKKEKGGKFLLTPDGLAVPPERPGYPEQYRRILIRETGNRYLVPEKK